MDAEKALAEFENALLDLCVELRLVRKWKADDALNFVSPEVEDVRAAARTLARAAFEERGHVRRCGCHEANMGCFKANCDNGEPFHVDPRCALPKWLTETSR